MSAKVSPLAHLPANLSHLIPVTRESFFAVLGPLDVNPSCHESPRYDRILGYQSQWKLRDGTLVAVTVGDTCFSHGGYLVTPAFFATHDSALVRVQETP